MSYRLGVDLGTTFTAAAVANGREPAMLGLGNRALQIPSVLFLNDDGSMLVGEAAERRGLAQPDRLVREFKRRIGDTVPMLVAGHPFSPQAFTARLLQYVVASATDRMGEPPAEVVLTHPANWGPYKLELLDQVARLAGVERWSRCPEPLAAAAQYAAQTRVNAGDVIAVYDLGGGTFDACLLQKTPSGYTQLGSPEGIEHLGGVDFDEALFQHVIGMLGDGLTSIDPDDPDAIVGLARLRRDCVDAKEALSTDTDAMLPVALPGLSTTLRLTRGEFENLIRPSLGDTVAALERAIRSAGLTADRLTAIVLVGGSSRIPLVGELLHAAFSTPTAMDTHPKHDIALGAVQVEQPTSAPAEGAAETSGPPTVPTGRRPPVPPTAALPTSGPGTAASGTAASAAAASAAAASVPLGSAAAMPPPPPEARQGPVVAATTSGPPSTLPATTVRSAAGRPPPPPPPGGALPAGVAGGPPAGLPPVPRRAADPGRRRRMIIIGATAAAVVAGIGIGVAVAAIGQRGTANPPPISDTSLGPQPSVSTSTSASASPTPSRTARGPATPAGLPRSAEPLAEAQMLVQMTSSGTEQVWVADERSGAPIRQLTTSAGSNAAMDISPAYDAMIYIHADSPSSPTNSMRVAGVEKLEGDRQLFARPAGCLLFNRPAWNPVDPNLLAVPCITTDRRYTIFLMTVRGKVIKKVAPPAGLPRLGDVVYSADGKRLCFWAASDADRAYDGGVLYTVSVDGGTPQPLIKDGAPTIKGSDADPSYSPDGRYVAFRRRVHTSPGKPDQTDVYRVNTDGTGLVQLTKSKLSEQNPTWSPDSTQIAYKSAVPTAALPSTDQNKIFLMTVDGDNQRPLLTEGAIGPQALAAWAPR